VSKMKAVGLSPAERGEADTETEPAFVVDGMLGRLARWMRIFGYDTWYVRNLPDGELVDMHLRSGRILLTRDTGLVHRAGLGKHLLIVYDRWDDQMQQVCRDLSLRVCRERCFTRCLRCNDLLEDAEPAAVRKTVPDYIAAVHRRFRRCPSCERVYWPGTHRSGMSRKMERFFSAHAS